MSDHLPKFLAVHFDGDFLEHAAFVESEEEWAKLTCLVAPGDHWDPVLIPIETAAAAPDLLRLAERYVDMIEGVYAEMGKKVPTTTQYRLSKEAIAKAKGK